MGTWNVRTMNQGKLKVVKQEVARVNIDILGISVIYFFIVEYLFLFSNYCRSWRTYAYLPYGLQVYFS